MLKRSGWGVRLLVLALVLLAACTGGSTAEPVIPTAASLDEEATARAQPTATPNVGPETPVTGADQPSPAAPVAAPPQEGVTTLPIGGGGITPGQPFLADVLPDYPAPLLLFALQRLDTYRVEATPDNPALDVQLTLLDPTNTAIAVINRGGPGAAEVIPEIVLPASGDYRLMVDVLAGEGAVSGLFAPVAIEDRAGGGRLEFLDADPDAEPFDLSADGTFFAPDVFHAYTADVRQGDILKFAVRAGSEAVAPVFTLYDGDYQVRGIFEVPPGGVFSTGDTLMQAAGTYTIYVRNVGEGTGPYSVRVYSEEG